MMCEVNLRILASVVKHSLFIHMATSVEYSNCLKVVQQVGAFENLTLQVFLCQPQLQIGFQM